MREYLLTLLVTAAVTYLLTGPVRKFAIAAKAMPEIRERDVHREPTPRLGGIAMFGGLCVGLLVASELPHIGTVFTETDEPRALLSGAGLIWLLGVLDDKWGVDALIKLGGQMVAAGVMVLQGLQILSLPVPGIGQLTLTPIQSTLLTVALVVVTINAVNFVDGLDGLASGMVCIAAIAFFAYAYRLWFGHNIESAAPATLFSAILIGMCLGFLPHNLHPARIFMGDSGSMLIGLMLSASAISVTGQVNYDDLVNEANGSQTEAVYEMVPVYIPLLLPLALIAVPMTDLVLAVVRRTWNGKSPFAADKQHLHHRLLEIGHSHSRAVLIMYFWSALIALGTVAFSVQSNSTVLPLVGIVLCAIGLVVLLMPRFRPKAPEWSHSFVPPRYRAGRGRAARRLGEASPTEQPSLNGATAMGGRHRSANRPHAHSAAGTQGGEG
ncbi:transferase [Wenjunlia vitaminophila]|uniref:Transferase n=1 Tax=Wenjunlia vitaminophila TaxID=76728 RepID=A0A0T6LTL5_WENVI|nr:MraY family glycosyltransferase [Wenjunlia vitaminophila]KRV49470.1 transferase [Wenjunlia vitaminophila]